MFENLLNSPILQNPIFVAAILAVIRNLGGYIYNCFEAKKILPYSGSQFLVTFGLWETVFVILAGGANLNSETTAVIAIALDWIRGLKTAISSTNTSTTTTTTTSTPSSSSAQPVFTSVESYKGYQIGTAASQTTSYGYTVFNPITKGIVIMGFASVTDAEKWLDNALAVAQK
ncbi:MAG: hypothetical protein ABSD73_09195 [Candidatus Bathyarchaeia archaeon]|jgi:hypothetical protein